MMVLQLQVMETGLGFVHNIDTAVAATSVTATASGMMATIAIFVQFFVLVVIKLQQTGTAMAIQTGRISTAAKPNQG